MRQYLLCKHYNLECMVNYLKGLFKNYIELQIPQTVHDLLKIDISATSLLEINAEELHTILSEIREFEQVTSEDNIGDSDCENDCDVENDFD